MTQAPTASDIALQPQLAVLGALDASLRHAALAVQAAHQDVLIQAWNPNASHQVRLAAAIVASTDALRQLLDQYCIATEQLIIDSIPC